MDWLSEGIMVTILGMGVVFAVLIFICLILALTGYIMKNSSDEKKEPQSKPQTAVPKTVSAPEVKRADDAELIAVLTAAIAEYEKSMGGYADPDKLVVRSFRRVHTWKREAIQEQQNNLF